MPEMEPMAQVAAAAVLILQVMAARGGQQVQMVSEQPMVEAAVVRCQSVHILIQAVAVALLVVAIQAVLEVLHQDIRDIQERVAKAAIQVLLVVLLLVTAQVAAAAHKAAAVLAPQACLLFGTKCLLY